MLKEKEEILSKIQEILQDKNIGILCVTKTIYDTAKEELNNISKTRNTPLVLKI